MHRTYPTLTYSDSLILFHGGREFHFMSVVDPVYPTVSGSPRPNPSRMCSRRSVSTACVPGLHTRGDASNDDDFNFRVGNIVRSAYLAMRDGQEFTN